ncbi:MAG TPA: phosphotransferase [Rhodocyclaceae bacterium]|nr:phosphotransferase [Rhodocyclaceae bacterium]
MDRLEQLRGWVAQLHPDCAFEISVASADASFRRYFRIRFADAADCIENTGSNTRIVMDAPPDHEDCRPFLHVAKLLQEAGVNVPEVHAQDLGQGFLLLSDLGSTTYLSALNEAKLNTARVAELYAEALGALACIQRASRPGVLPEYDRALLLRELELFPVWYVARHKGMSLSDADSTALYAAFDSILNVNLSEPQVFVHRDFHSRNLMLTTPNPGILDFQDAVYGPLTYDLVSLFKDAYIEWDEELTLDWLARYWDTSRKLGIPVRDNFADFHRDYEFMGAQRHLKVLGIFTRLYHRDGKDGYLKDMPLVLKHLRKTCQRYRELHPLARLLDKLEPVDIQTGYTF